EGAAAPVLAGQEAGHVAELRRVVLMDEEDVHRVETRRRSRTDPRAFGGPPPPRHLPSGSDRDRPALLRRRRARTGWPALVATPHRLIGTSWPIVLRSSGEPGRGGLVPRRVSIT